MENLFCFQKVMKPLMVVPLARGGKIIATVNSQVPLIVRFHVAEKKDELKRELGPAFYKLGLDKTGEDAALTWTKGDERRFNTIIQDNLPTSKYNFWGKLRAAFRSKGSKGLASYYHNVFQVRRRAYQNHVALNADSDDDSIEPGFLYTRQGDVKGSSRSRSTTSSRNGRSS